MNEFTAVKDSGKREEMPTGSVRDTREGKGRFDLLSPMVLLRDAKHMENGARKYGARNWELGQPFSRFLDSAMRHLVKWQAGHRDEDHLAAARWNLGCIIHFEETGKWDLDDMPKYVGPQAPTEPLPSPVPPKERKVVGWGVRVPAWSCPWLTGSYANADSKKMWLVNGESVRVYDEMRGAEAAKNSWSADHPYSPAEIQPITDDMIVSVPQAQ